MDGNSSGRHQIMLETAVAAAREAGLLAGIDEAMLSVARAAAFALDAAEASDKPVYAIANTITPYTAALRELQLTPSTRASSDVSPFDALLEGITEAE